MAVTTLAVAGLAVSAGSAINQSNQAKKGLAAGERATDMTVAEKRRQFDQTQANQQPFLDAGYGALDRQNAFLSGDTSGFENSADYKFAVDQGFKGLNYGRSASGGFGAGGFAGGPDADRIALGQGLATQYAGNYWSKLAGMAGQGQQGSQYLGQMGANMAGNLGNAWANQAGNRASSYANQANAWGKFGQDATQLGAWYLGQRAPQTASQPSNAFSSGFGNNTDWLTNGSYGGMGGGW